jgi:methyl-accepting chemotaxis protein
MAEALGGNDEIFRRWLEREINLHARLQAEEPLERKVNAFVERLEGLLEPTMREVITVSQEAFKQDADSTALFEISAQQGMKVGKIVALTMKSDADVQGIASHAEDLFSTAGRAQDASHVSSAKQSEFLKEMEFIHKTLVETSAAMESLRKESEAIREMGALMENLSSQLNVLAINASIEAARSGAAGKGFAVISKEMRNLQEKANESAMAVTSRIGSIIHGIGESDASLTRAKDSVRRGKDDAEAIGEKLTEIDGINGEINQRVGEIRDLVRSQLQQSEAIKAMALEMRASGDIAREKSEGAKRGSERLHQVVDTLGATISPFRFEWHERVAHVLDSIVEKVSNPAEIGALKSEFGAHPYYELFYVMADDGTQISENVENPKAAFTENPQSARGVSRAGKDYFSRARAEDRAYFTDVYLSSATRRLCLTVSRRFERGGKSYVLAGDINIDGLLRMLDGQDA